MPQTLKLQIDGMHCDACVRRVKAALDNQPGVTVNDVKVGEATVRVEPPADKAALHATLEEIGFELTQTDPL